MKHLGEAETAEERAAEAAIAACPAWDGRAARYALLCPDVVSPVHRGVESAIWRVETEGAAPAILKILRDDMLSHFDPAAAIDGARRAGEAGAGPPLIWADADLRAVALPELADGWRTATLADLQDPAVMVAALDAAKRLHAGAPAANRFSVFAVVRTLAERAKTAGADLPPDFWWLERAVAEVAQAIAAAGADSAPCRNDGVSSNVMIGPDGGVLLIDHDRAGQNDPLYDLAVLLVEAHPFDSEMLPAIEHWCGRADPALLNRCVAYGVADDLMWALWAVLNVHESPRRHVEFGKYSQWRFLRCRMAVGDPRFEERLRRL